MFPRPLSLPPPVVPRRPPRLPPPEDAPPFLATFCCEDLFEDAAPLDEELPRLLRLADDPPPDELRLPAPDDFLVAAFFVAPFLGPPEDELPPLDEDFLAALFLDAPREDELPPLEEDFFAAPFLVALFLDAPFFDAAFLDAPFFAEPPLPEEPPRPEDFFDAPFLLAPFFEDLPPPEDLLPLFLAAFLVDFAIVNGFYLRLKEFSFLKLR